MLLCGGAEVTKIYYQAGVSWCGLCCASCWNVLMNALGILHMHCMMSVHETVQQLMRR
jgi:hypothetical protein